MQSFVWKPGISVSTASLGNSGVIDTLKLGLNSFDRLEATDSGWEYQPYELAGSSKRPKRRRLVPKCTNCACLFAVHLAFVLWSIPTGRLLSRRSRVAHRCDGRQQSTVNS